MRMRRVEVLHDWLSRSRRRLATASTATVATAHLRTAGGGTWRVVWSAWHVAWGAGLVATGALVVLRSEHGVASLATGGCPRRARKVSQKK